jgi:ribosomal protein S18 acetylase RimI-like enzyme
MKPSAGFVIDFARSEDVNKLVELEKRVFLASDGPLSRRAFLYHVHHARNIMLVARSVERAGDLYGYILLLRRLRSGRVYSLAVSPEVRGRGVGSALLKAGLHRLAMAGIQHIHLELRDNNDVALRLYTEHGFIVDGDKPDFYTRGEPALCMTCTLS